MSNKNEPVIFITSPETNDVIENNISVQEYNYDNSHLFFKGIDIGTFKEITNMKKENKQLKEQLQQRDEVINKIREIIDKSKYTEIDFCDNYEYGIYLNGADKDYNILLDILNIKGDTSEQDIKS